MLWVGQNGQDLWEQAYVVHKGDNCGWSVNEGSHPFQPQRDHGPDPIVLPAVEHHHSEFRSLTGGVVYYGKKYPDLDGCLRLRRLFDGQNLGGAARRDEDAFGPGAGRLAACRSSASASTRTANC